jgi:glycosyltransferase involved in cell wall biosynthesis
LPIDNDDTVYLFVKNNVDVSEFENKFKIVRFESESAIKRNFIELNKLCKKYDIEVLHTQYFIPFFRTCKVVCTIHDICFEHYKNIFTKKEYITQKLLIPYAAKHSEYIFTVSEHAKADIVAKYNIDPEKVIVTYNAVNESFRVLSSEELQEEDLRNKFSIGSGPYILSVGNLQPRKNLPRLIQAFIGWKEKNVSNTKLVIVGKKAWLYNDILKAAGAESSDIILTDYVTNEDLIRLYNAAECFIYPSFFEGFGIPPLEAMACGTPVAVANATSLPEVVGTAAILFDPFDVEQISEAINKLVTDDVVKKRLREDGFIRLNHFNWSESSRLIYNTYHRCN